MATFPTHATTALAGHGRRLGAALLDALFYGVFVAAFGAAGFVVGLVGAQGADTADDGWEQLGWILAGTILGFLIGVVCWLVLIVWLVRRPLPRNGQTLGKQAMGIRVVRADGTPLGAGTALLREILAKWLFVAIATTGISGLLGFADGGLLGVLVVGAIWYGPAFVDEQRRGLHDRMVGTRVVDAKAGIAAPPPTDELWPATP